MTFFAVYHPTRHKANDMTEAILTAARTADAEESVPRSAGALAHIVTIAKRELVSYFESPIAHVFIVIFLLLEGFFTFMVSDFFERGEANLEPFFAWHLWLYLFLVPAIGMRMWSEERRSGTMELLLTMPITHWQAIVGKFIAAWLVLALALTFPIVITVNYLGRPDNGVIVAGYIGSLLLAGAYLSISAMTSALTRNQVVSFILSVVICLFLVLVGYSPVTNLLVRWANPWVVQAVSAFSVVTHFESIRKGVIDSRDILFFLSVIGFSLFTTSGRIQKRILRSEQIKSPAPCFQDAGRNFWQRPTLAQPIDALPSGLQRFTSVFGMGTGGATALRSPESCPDSLGADFWRVISITCDWPNGRFTIF